MALFTSAAIYRVYIYINFLVGFFLLCVLYFKPTFHMISSRKMAIDLLTLFLGFSHSKERTHSHSDVSGCNIVF